MKNIQTFGCIRYFSFMNYFLSVKFDLWIAEILNNLSNVTAIPLDFHKAWSINSGLYNRAKVYFQSCIVYSVFYLKW